MEEKIDRLMNKEKRRESVKGKEKVEKLRWCIKNSEEIGK